MVCRVKYPRYLHSTQSKRETYILSEVSVYTKAVGNPRVRVELSEVPPLSQIFKIYYSQTDMAHECTFME